jgi:hypothetical protein
MRAFQEAPGTRESMRLMNARELSNHLAELLRNERHAMADFLVALSVFDRDGAWSKLGHNSLFNYLHHDLGLSKGAAFYRVTAAPTPTHR